MVLENELKRVREKLKELIQENEDINDSTPIICMDQAFLAVNTALYELGDETAKQYGIITEKMKPKKAKIKAEATA